MNGRATRKGGGCGGAGPTAVGALALCLALIVSPAVAATRPLLPKGVVAVARGEGRFELAATVAAQAPSEGEVLRLSPRERLEEAAARLCPQGYHLDADEQASLRVDGSGRFVTKLRGVATCKAPGEIAP